MPKNETDRDELEKEFRKTFDRDCYEYSCEARDCCECSIYQDALEEYINEKTAHPENGTESQ